MINSQSIKTIGANGQLSLGKAFAGKTVAVEQLDDNTWVIKSGEFVPESEKWLHKKEQEEKLLKSLNWTKNNKPKDNFANVAKSIEDA